MSNHRLLIDTGFFFALFDKTDQYHVSACKLLKQVGSVSIILPWPVLYETINTRFLKERMDFELDQFNAIVESPRTELLDDSPYRLESYQVARKSVQRGWPPPLSLVDAILCAIVEDANVRVEAMLTFDLRNFSYLCQKHNVELLWKEQ